MRVNVYFDRSGERDACLLSRDSNIVGKLAMYNRLTSHTAELYATKMTYFDQIRIGREMYLFSIVEVYQVNTYESQKPGYCTQ